MYQLERIQELLVSVGIIMIKQENPVKATLTDGL